MSSVLDNQPSSEPPTPQFVEWLAAQAEGETAVLDRLPWAGRLSDEQRERFYTDLSLVLSEPVHTGEPVDWREIQDILREYSELVGWEGPLTISPDEPPPEAVFAVDIRDQELRTLERASAAVQAVVRDLLTRFLRQHPTDAQRLERGKLKKLSNRDIWQVDLPDGYRLRYYVAEPEQVVYVVYLGPHPDGEVSGRERSVQGMVQRRRHGGTS